MGDADKIAANLSLLGQRQPGVPSNKALSVGLAPHLITLDLYLSHTNAPNKETHSLPSISQSKQKSEVSYMEDYGLLQVND